MTVIRSSRTFRICACRNIIRSKFKIAEEAQSAFKKLTKENDNYAIIYVEETYYKDLSAEIDKFKDSPTPAIILIPGREGSLGLGQSALQSAVLRAVGSDIL